MLDPYRMVVVNIVASLLLLFGSIVYIYIFPKKKINLFALLLLISILPLLSLLRKGDYESGDFNIHIYRIISFYDSLREGILMPSWAAELNATYGDPLFIFNYSLPYYLISFFHFTGISFISSTKIYLGLTLYLSGIFMYIWVKELTGNKLAAFTSAIFYVFNPYHLIDVHFRATLGESTIFAIVPLQFLFITKYLKEKGLINLVLLSLFTGLIFLAHPLLAFVFLGIEVLFTSFLFLKNRDVKTFINTILSLISGSIASSYTWISFILFAPYMFTSTIQRGHFVPDFYYFNHLFYSPWRYGLLFQGPKGELALVIGYVQIFIMIASAVLICTKKIRKKIYPEYVFWICLFLFIIFLMHPSSGFIWKNFYTSGGMIIGYGRLSLVISLCTSVIAGYFILSLSILKVRKTYIYILLLITIAYTILNWGHRRVIPEIDDTVLRKNVWLSTVYEGKTAYFLNTKWADPNNFWFTALPKNHIEIVNGVGVVKQLKRTSTKHAYIIDAKTPITVKENTLYFPGWSLKSNNEKVAIYPGKRGVMHAALPKGLQYLEFTYDDLFVYKITKLISLGIFSILISLILLSILPVKISKK